MSDNIWFTAAFWMGLAFVASLVSIRTGISVALIEILVGVIVGNLHAAGQASILHTTEWINFLAMLGSTAMGKMLLAACFITDFGTVLALGVLFGLQNKIISQQQYSMLVTVVILSAFVPTLLAQRLFQPTVRMMTAWGRLYSHRINRKSAVLSAPVKG